MCSCKGSFEKGTEFCGGDRDEVAVGVDSLLPAKELTSKCDVLDGYCSGMRVALSGFGETQMEHDCGGVGSGDHVTSLEGEKFARPQQAPESDVDAEGKGGVMLNHVS